MSIIRTVLRCIMDDSCKQWYAHIYERFLNLTVGFRFRFSLHLGVLSVFYHTYPVFFTFGVLALVWFSTTPRDWPARSSPKSSVLCPVGRKTLTQSQLNPTSTSVDLWWEVAGVNHHHRHYILQLSTHRLSMVLWIQTTIGLNYP